MTKDQEIKIRISKEDKEQIVMRAKKSGLSLSEYCRKIALNGEIKIISDEEKKDLRAIGNNVNQIAYHLNARPGELNAEKVLESLIRTLNFLKRAYR